MLGRLISHFGSRGMAVDPVCHMKVDIIKSSVEAFEYEGKLYYFCGPGCRVSFSEEPEPYLSGEKYLEM